MIRYIPISVAVMKSKFDLARFLVQKLDGVVRDGDVLVVSSKFVAMSEGRVVRLAEVKVGARAMYLGEKYRMDSRLCELVLRESDEVLGGIPGFLLAIKDNLLTPNAGIDKSNVEHGSVILYPRDPAGSASEIRQVLLFSMGVSIGVIVCDSRLSPTRRGTSGVAVAASGVEAVLDLRGRKDLFGGVLKVTSQAIADDLSSGAELLMGESDERMPLVLVRGMRKNVMKETEYGASRFAIPIQECVYMRSLGFADNPR